MAGISFEKRKIFRDKVCRFEYKTYGKFRLLNEEENVPIPNPSIVVSPINYYFAINGEKYCVQDEDNPWNPMPDYKEKLRIWTEDYLTEFDIYRLQAENITLWATYVESEFLLIEKKITNLKQKSKDLTEMSFETKQCQLIDDVRYYFEANPDFTHKYPMPPHGKYLPEAFESHLITLKECLEFIETQRRLIKNIGWKQKGKSPIESVTTIAQLDSTLEKQDQYKITLLSQDLRTAGFIDKKDEKKILNFLLGRQLKEPCNWLGALNLLDYFARKLNEKNITRGTDVQRKAFITAFVYKGKPISETSFKNASFSKENYAPIDKAINKLL